MRTGIDLLEIGRLEGAIQRHGKRLLDRIYTPRELAEAGADLASLAMCFAAKEAVSKALGTGIGDISWQEIEIQDVEAQAPKLYLTGNAKKIAEMQGLSKWMLSISYGDEYSIAIIIAH